MLSFGSVAPSDFDALAQSMAFRFEVHDGSNWQDLTEVVGTQGTEKVTDGELDVWTSSSNLTNWTEEIAGTSTVAQESSIVFSGSYSAKFTCDASGNQVDVYQPVTLVGGERYRLTGWYKTDYANAAVIVLETSDFAHYLVGPDGSWAINATWNYQPAATSWRRFCYEFTAPSDHTAYILGIGAKNVANAVVYFDKVSLVPIPPPAVRADVLANWKYRKQIKVSGTYIDSNLSHFPVCVKLTRDVDVGGKALSTGYDIRFTAEDGQTLLPYEREYWNVTNGAATGVFWVNVPQLKAAKGGSIFIYYGKSGASDGQDTTKVWDAYFKAVYHGGHADATHLNDSTANMLSATKKAAGEPLQQLGTDALAYVQTFDGSDDYVQNPVPQPTAPVTTEFWVKGTWATGSHYLGWMWSNGYIVYIGDSGTEVRFYDGAQYRYLDVGSSINDNAWHHIVLVDMGSGNSVILYVDGVAIYTGTSSLSYTTSLQYIGTIYDNSSGWFAGSMGEIRFTQGTGSARSAAWLKFTYRNIKESDNCLTFSAEETLTRSYVKSMSCQAAGAGPSSEPLAGAWSVMLDNEDGTFHPYHPTSAYKDLLRLGRKARLSWGGWFSPNLLTDGELDVWTSATDLTNWTESIAGTSTVNREANVVKSGTYSCRLDVDASDSLAQVYQSNIPMVYGAWYRISGWFKTASGKNAASVYQTSIGGTSYYLQSDGLWYKVGDPGYTGTWFSGSSANADWEEKTISFQFPANGDNPYGQLVLKRASGSSSSSIYFDKWKLEPLGWGRTKTLWQRIIGWMDPPHFNHKDSSVSVNGGDYTKALTDTLLYSPYTHWGDSYLTDAVASGGSGTEMYDEADACEIGAHEANNVTNWATGGSGTVSSVTGSKSNYALKMQAAQDDTWEYAHNSNVGTLVAGLTYVLEFWAKINSSGRGRVGLYDTVSGAAHQIGSAYIVNPGTWNKYTITAVATAAGAAQIRVSLGGLKKEIGDAVYLDEVSLKPFSPADWYMYEMPDGCRGVYYVEYNGGSGWAPIWHGDEDGAGGWHYDEAANVFYFSQDLTIIPGTNNLKIYYYTDVAAEDVVADMLVAAHLYTTRANAKAAMNYTSPGVTINQCWFDTGSNALNAIRLVCERCNYRFWFAADGTPNFRIKPGVTSPPNYTFSTAGALGDMTLYHSLEEVRNHIIIEGCERSVLNVSTQEVERQTWKGEASDSTSIATYLEKTYSIQNRLFQDQASVDGMADSLLAQYKDPNIFIEVTAPISAIPLEIGDTISVQVPLSNAFSVTKQVIIRAVNLQNGEARYTCEVFVPTNSVLAPADVSFNFPVEGDIQVAREGYLTVQDISFGFAVDAPTIWRVITYTTYQNGTEVPVPAGYTQAVIECWGSGAYGGDIAYEPSGANGGGGGGYSKKTLTVATGNSLYVYLNWPGMETNTYVVYQSSTVCSAEDGKNNGTGGSSANGVGDTKYSGGDGYYTGGEQGGGGGGSGGTGSNGNDATSRIGASAVTGGGNGGTGGNAYSDGNAPTTPPGGGGGGAGGNDSGEQYGGSGSYGKVIITFKA